MKRFFKIFKILLIVIVALVALLYGGVYLGHKVLFKEPVSNVPTIAAVSDGMLTLGLQPNPPAAIEDYVKLLAKQVARYNQYAPELWPNTALVNQSVIVEEIQDKQFWLLAPDGTVTPLSEDDALGYGFHRQAYFGGFDFFDG
ncbi:MAG: hypothetical protein LBR56_03675, partial [Sporomusaceae bacterium]|nr:hypothetical protein [Sporomusaceae bacterium]